MIYLLFKIIGWSQFYRKLWLDKLCILSNQRLIYNIDIQRQTQIQSFSTGLSSSMDKTLLKYFSSWNNTSIDILFPQNFLLNFLFFKNNPSQKSSKQFTNKGNFKGNTNIFGIINIFKSILEIIYAVELAEKAWFKNIILLSPFSLKQIQIQSCFNM